MPLGVPPRRFFLRRMKVDAASSLYGLYLVAASPLATADQSVILRVRRHSKRVGSVLSFYVFVLWFGTLCLVTGSVSNTSTRAADFWNRGVGWLFAVRMGLPNYWFQKSH